MNHYRYRAERSQAPEHQTPGLRRAVFFTAGTISAPDADTAMRFIEPMLLMPGTYTVELARGERLKLKPRTVTVAKK